MDGYITPNCRLSHKTSYLDMKQSFGFSGCWFLVWMGIGIMRAEEPVLENLPCGDVRLLAKGYSTCAMAAPVPQSLSHSSPPFLAVPRTVASNSFNKLKHISSICSTKLDKRTCLSERTICFCCLPVLMLSFHCPLKPRLHAWMHVAH